MKNINVKVVEDQQEVVNSERELSDEETKAFLYKNYPDLYKQMYPNENKVINKPRNGNQSPKPHQKREGNDIQQSDKTYVYNKYKDSSLSDGSSLGYKITITTDMDLD